MFSTHVYPIRIRIRIDQINFFICYKINNIVLSKYNIYFQSFMLIHQTVQNVSLYIEGFLSVSNFLVTNELSVTRDTKLYVCYVLDSPESRHLHLGQHVVWIPVIPSRYLTSKSPK